MRDKEDLITIIEQLDRQLVAGPLTRVVMSEFGVDGDGEERFLSQLALWRRAILLSLLYRKSRDDRRLLPFFDALFQFIRQRTDSMESLVRAIKLVAMTPQLEWGSQFIIDIRQPDSGTLNYSLRLAEEILSISRELSEYADTVFGRTVYASEQNYDEGAYLAANPVVAEAIGLGQFTSGKEHFLHYGIREQRKLVFAGTLALSGILTE